MTPYKVPLTSGAQTLTVNMAGVQYQLVVRWCAPSSCWVLDIYTATGDTILLALPLVTGTDLLGQFKHLNIGGELRVESDEDLTAVPQYNDLGVSGHLYFVIP